MPEDKKEEGGLKLKKRPGGAKGGAGGVEYEDLEGMVPEIDSIIKNKDEAKAAANAKLKLVKKRRWVQSCCSGHWETYYE